MLATTYLGLLAVTFFIGRVVPIDPVLAIVGDRAPAAVVERVREEMGFNLPLWRQFILYLQQALTGDFGTSVLTTNPVMEDILRVFPATLELATVGTLIGAGLGVPLGVVAAVRRGSIADQIVRIVGLIGYLAKAGEHVDSTVDPVMVTGIAVPFVVLAVWTGVRAIRRGHSD